MLIPVAFLSLKRKNLKYLHPVPIFLLGIVIGSLQTPAPVSSLTKYLEGTGKPCYAWVKGKILQSEPWREGNRSIIRISAYEPSDRWIETNTKILAYLPGKAPAAGSCIRASLKMKEIRSPSNPGQFDAKSYYARRNIRITGSCYDINLVKVSNPPWWKFVGRYRRTIESRLIRDTGKEDGVLLALLLGERGLLTETQQETLVNSGLYHLVALSGLHVGLILILLFSIANLIGTDPFTRDILGIIIIISYGFLASSRPSLTRALFMAGLFLLLGVAGRKSDGLFAWSAAFAVLLLINPTAFLDTGFQLTFGATLSIILLWNAQPKWTPKNGIAGMLSRALWIGVSAQLATFPLVIQNFHRASSSGWIATPIAALPLMFIQLLGLPYIAGMAFIPGLHTLMGHGLAVGARLFMLMPDLLSRGFLRAHFLAIPHVGWICIYLLGLVGIASGKRIRTAGWALIAVAVAGSMFQGFVSSPVYKPSMVVLDVGEASCQVVLADKQTILVDAGTGSFKGPTSARTVIEPFLASAGIDRLDGILLTHWDFDHSGSLPDLIRDMRVGFLAYPATDPPVEGRIKMIARLAKRRGVKLVPLSVESPDQTVTPSIHILNPSTGEHLSSENNRCLVFSLNIGGARLLFTGDIEREAEKEIITSRCVPPVYGMMVPHHGSATSSTPGLLDKLLPRVAFISDGRFNRFGHPAEKILSRYEYRKVKIYRTDIDGAILMNSPANRPVVKVMRNGNWISSLGGSGLFR